MNYEYTVRNSCHNSLSHVTEALCCYCDRKYCYGLEIPVTGNCIKLQCHATDNSFTGSGIFVTVSKFDMSDK